MIPSDRIVSPWPTRLMFGGLLVAGVVVELVLKPPLYGNPQAIGMHAAGLLIPFVASMVFAAWTILFGRLNRTRTMGAVSLFVLLTLPFFDVFTQPIVHHKQDDSYRHSLYAHNIIEKRTLLGSDQLFHGASRSRVYIDQPGYRYYLAVAITAVGGEHRGLQLANMGLLLAVTLSFLNRLMAREERKLAAGFALFFVATAPYAAKNIVYGYSEWFAVVLFIGAAQAVLSGRYALMIVLIALVPFVRQNLLVVSVIVALFTIAVTRRWFLLLPYVVVLGLPLYHNLYYARQARFLVEQTGVIAPLTGSVWQDVLIKFGGYAGFMPGEKLLTLLIAVLFAPLGTLMVIRTVRAAEPKIRFLFILLIAAAVVPTLLLGSGSYPRFEYVNLTVILLSFAIVAATRRRPFAELLTYN